jgi:type III secretory pathway component EscR
VEKLNIFLAIIRDQQRYSSTDLTSFLANMLISVKFDESKHTLIPNRRASVIRLRPAVAVATVIATFVIGYFFFTRPLSFATIG